jgi:hypothetical protein
MPTGDEYRAKAAEFLAKAQGETDPSAIFEFHTLARSYLRLAELAERNARADIVYEPPTHDAPGGEPILLKSAAPTEAPAPITAPDNPDSEIA